MKNFAFFDTVRAATLFSAADVARAKFIFFNSQYAHNRVIYIKIVRGACKNLSEEQQKQILRAFLRLHVTSYPIKKAASAALQLVTLAGDASWKKLRKEFVKSFDKENGLGARQRQL